MIDARNARVYGGIYKNGKVLQETCVMECAEFCEKIEQLLNDGAEQVIFIGDGALANKELISEKFADKSVFVPVEFSCGNPQALSFVAAKKYSEAAEAGKLAECDAQNLKVNYYKNYTDSI